MGLFNLRHSRHSKPTCLPATSPRSARCVHGTRADESASAMREARRCGAHPAMTGVRVANRVLRPAAQSLPGARGFLSALMRRFRDGFLPRDTNDVETSVVDPRRRRHGRDWRPGRSIDVRLFLGFSTTTRASAFLLQRARAHPADLHVPLRLPSNSSSRTASSSPSSTSSSSVSSPRMATPASRSA